uniref:Uncharacterized protein n=1 Tax=Anguilla anguilla TaxID=7936 RepID=A0A0E9W9C5_ANGAN
MHHVFHDTCVDTTCTEKKLISPTTRSPRTKTLLSECFLCGENTSTIAPIGQLHKASRSVCFHTSEECSNNITPAEVP